MGSKVLPLLPQATRREALVASLLLKTLAEDQERLRQMPIQNRLALNYVLASEALCACAVISEECCTDANSSFDLVNSYVNDALVHAAKATYVPKDTSAD